MPLLAQRQLVFVVIFLAALVCLPRAHGEVASTTLQKLTARADAIAVARVTRVERIGGVRVASAVVVRPFKGLGPNQRLAFLAQGTWTCDESYAVSGETVLLFLTKPPAAGLAHDYLRRRPWFGWLKARRLPGVPFYHIAHSGAGRMPVTWKKGRGHLSAWGANDAASGGKVSAKTPTKLQVGLVKLPVGLSASPVRKLSDWRTSYLVPLHEVEDIVRRYLKQSQPLTLATAPLR